jgi:hypothetical protein
LNKPLPPYIYIAIWLLLAIAFGCLLGWRVPRLITLKERGVPCEAEVVSVTPELHNTFKYSYAVDNKTYKGEAHIIDVAPGIGSKLAITYLPESPDFSYAGDIQGQIDNDRISAALASIIFPSLVVACYVFRIRGRDRKAAR